MKTAPFIINGLMMLFFGLIGLFISWIFLIWVVGGLGLIVVKTVWAMRHPKAFAAPPKVSNVGGTKNE